MRYFKPFAALSMSLVISHSVFSDQSLTELLEPSRQILNNPQEDKYDLKNLVEFSLDRKNQYLEVDENQEMLDDAINRSKGIVSHVMGQKVEEFNNQKKAENPINPDEQLMIFISTSIPESKLLEMFKQGSKHNAIFYVRGLTGRSLDSTIKHFRKMVSGFDPQPQIYMDPKIFKTHKVTSVPHMVYQTPKMIVSTQGYANATWYMEQIEKGRTDIPKLSNVYKIKERDVIEELKERAAQLDPEEIKKKALANYWKNQVFEALEPAKDDRYREVDMSIVVTRDIKMPDGQILARKGQVINPLTKMGFPGRVIVFNPTLPEHVDFVNHLIPTLDNENIVMVASEFPREDAWKKIADLEVKVGRPVYQLQKNMRERFKVEHVPSLIYPAKDVIAIQEYSEESVNQTNALGKLVMAHRQENEE